MTNAERKEVMRKILGLDTNDKKLLNRKEYEYLERRQCQHILTINDLSELTLKLKRKND